MDRKLLLMLLSPSLFFDLQQSVLSEGQGDPYFLGCFVTWSNLELGSHINAGLTSEVKSCQLQNQQGASSLLLVRGNLCIYTNLLTVIKTTPDLALVPLAFCDLDCEPDGHCGGNWFYSGFCYSAANSTSECSIPNEVPTQLKFSLPVPQQTTINYSDLKHRCVPKSLVNLTVHKTYFPHNSPISCTNYCQAAYRLHSMNFDLQNYTVGIYQSVAVPSANCFCIEATPKLSLHHSVPEQLCFSSNPEFISLYTLPRFSDTEPLFEEPSLQFNITMNDHSDIGQCWNTEYCQYYATYNDFNFTNPRCRVFILDETEPPPNGFWNNCPVPCGLNFSSPHTQFYLTAITVRYYVKPLNHGRPKLLVNYRSMHDAGWHYGGKEDFMGEFGWGEYTLKMANAIQNPEIYIELQSRYNPFTGKDFIMIDTITVTLAYYWDVESGGSPRPPVNSQILMDTESDLVAENWRAINCQYANNYIEYYFTLCSTLIPCPPEGHKHRVGFWSGCTNARRCVLRYKIPENRIPISLEVNAYIRTAYEDECQMEIHVAAGNTTETLRGEGWLDGFTIPLENLEAGEAISIFQSSCNNGWVMVDKVILTLAEPPDPTTTTAVPPISPPPITCDYKDMCNHTDHRGLYWSACPGETKYQLCPTSVAEVAEFVGWKCLETGFFSPTGANYTACSSGWYADLEAKVNSTTLLSSSEAHEYLLEMQQNTASTGKDPGSEFYGHEISAILELGEKILNKVDLTTGIIDMEMLTETTISVHRNVLVNPTPWEDLNENAEALAGTKFLKGLELTSFELTARVIAKGRGRDYLKTYESHGELRATATSTEKFAGILIYPQNPEEAQASIEIPSGWANSFEDQDYVDFVGTTILSKYANQVFRPPSWNHYIPSSRTVVNGDMVSFTFGHGGGNRSISGRRQVQFKNTGSHEVRIRFKHDSLAWGNEVKNVRRNLHFRSGEKPRVALSTMTNPCAYWDEVEVKWSTAGCWMVAQTEFETVCECDHLSSFAILMQTHNYVGKDDLLEVLSWGLCSLSILCLILCIIVYSIPTIATIRGPRSVITLHLCICLLVGNILMMGFVDKNYIHLTNGFCTTFGIMAHYFFLAAFFWMAFESYVIYKVLVIVFDDGQDHFGRQYLVSYGCPGVIVLGTGIYAVVQRHDAYESDMYCWLTGNYIWAFNGPIALILVGNTVMLVLAMRKAITLSKNPTVKSHRHKKPYLAWIKGCASLTTLLGITWGVGYFMLVDNSDLSNVAAYVFTILNASQGVFIFVFHVCFNEKIRQTIWKMCAGVFLPYWESFKTSTTGMVSSQNEFKELFLTFGTACQRRRKRVSKLFNVNLSQTKDNCMPKSDDPNAFARRANVKVATKT